ncbi:MAG: hypothetical protein AAF663_01695 [Planctomycetota bacterium]
MAIAFDVIGEGTSITTSFDADFSGSSPNLIGEFRYRLIKVENFSIKNVFDLFGSIGEGIAGELERELVPGSYRLETNISARSISQLFTASSPLVLQDTSELDIDFSFLIDGVAIEADLSQVLVPLPLPGDFDNSGAVEQGDLNLVLNNWGQDAPFEANGDPFLTPTVDQEELNRVLNNWGSSVAPSFAGLEVPEPAAGLAVLVGLFALRSRSRRRIARCIRTPRRCGRRIAKGDRRWWKPCEVRTRP